MARYPDMTEYVHGHCFRTMTNVGWLGRGTAFDTRPTSPQFRQALLELVARIRVNVTPGFRQCDLCGAGPGIEVPFEGGTIVLGNAELHFRGWRGFSFAAPDLIYHYVAEHGYRPPKPFMEDVLEMAPRYRVPKGASNFTRNYDDLSEYVNFTIDDNRTRVNIGWLGLGSTFDTGETSPEFRRALLELIDLRGVCTMRGWRQCEFCDGYEVAVPYATARHGRLLLGNQEVHVPGANGVIYAATNLVYHYVVAHGYRPPAQFVEAVLVAAAQPGWDDEAVGPLPW